MSSQLNKTAGFSFLYLYLDHMKRVNVIGGGFAGLSAASYLAKGGCQVSLFDKHQQIGGRARMFEAEGFTFDMGPSWYWMPDVFERFYNDFGHTTSDFYDLVRLDPSYQVFFSDGDVVKLPADYTELETLFESYEPGSAAKLRKFLDSAKYKYDVGVGEYVQKPSLSLLEYIDWRVLTSFFRLKMFSSIAFEIRSLFSNPKLIELLEFPVLFLGAKPEDTPALYSLMNYADIQLGTWYPIGGMSKIPEAMATIARDQGVDIHTDAEVDSIITKSNLAKSIAIGDKRYDSDYFVSAADYHHTETKLLDSKDRSYSDQYWDKRVMAPSSLLFYLGVDGKVDGLLHHNLFFDADFAQHAHQIYDEKVWPDQPLFYICCPSKTDDSVAPEGKENVFILVPLAAGLQDDMTKREELFDLILERIKNRLGVDLSERIVYKRSFCVDDFKREYNSYKGNAYGLSNVLMQTAFLKPKMKSKRVKNLYYAGQLTTPGPGVPPSIISGEVAARCILRQKP